MNKEITSLEIRTQEMITLKKMERLSRSNVLKGGRERIKKQQQTNPNQVSSKDGDQKDNN